LCLRRRAEDRRRGQQSQSDQQKLHGRLPEKRSMTGLTPKSARYSPEMRTRGRDKT
jgi:hypothetical protein